MATIEENIDKYFKVKGNAVFVFHEDALRRLPINSVIRIVGSGLGRDGAYYTITKVDSTKRATMRIDEFSHNIASGSLHMLKPTPRKDFEGTCSRLAEVE